MKTMKTEKRKYAFRLKYRNGECLTVIAESSLEVIKKYDLSTRANCGTRIIRLTGEQEAIAFANEFDN